MGCDQCKDWDACSHFPTKDPRDDWFSPSDIHWCPNQLEWLIKYVWETHEVGYWPPECSESEHSRGASHHASFEMACLILCELSIRLKRTGKAGKTLIDLIRSGSKFWKNEDALDAFKYCQGKHKMMSFSDWRKQRKYRGSQSVKNLDNAVSTVV